LAPQYFRSPILEGEDPPIASLEDGHGGCSSPLPPGRGQGEGQGGQHEDATGVHPGNPETIGFTRDGDRRTNSVVLGAIQLVKDVSTELHLAFFAPAAATSGNIEVRARFGVDMAQGPVLDARGDTGVQFGFSDESNSYLASAIMRDNVNRVAIVMATGDFSNGLVVPYDGRDIRGQDSVRLGP